MSSGEQEEGEDDRSGEVGRGRKGGEERMEENGREQERTGENRRDRERTEKNRKEQKRTEKTGGTEKRKNGWKE